MSDFLKSCVLPSSIFPCSPQIVNPVQTLDEFSPTAPISSLVCHSQALSSSNPDKTGSPPEQSLIPIQDPGGLVSSPFLKTLVGASSGVMEQKEYGDSSETSGSLPMVPTGVGAGLLNLGNTCFINSVLQCVTHSVPLIESLRSYNCESKGICVMKVLREHIESAVMHSGHTIRPTWFRDNLDYFSSEFMQNQQEDAHEFLQSFLDKFERCCVDPRDQGANNVDQIFGGRLLSRLRCCNCNSFSDTFESSLGWSLEIEDVDDLWSALESFTRVEKLEDQFTCDDCNNKVFKEKHLMLHELPLIASFHLKRFKNDGVIMEKIFNHVKFPLELDLSPYMSHSQQYPNGSTKYHLYAFVEHHGIRVTSGHYTAYVRSAPEVWHHFDDSKVTRISEDTVLSQDPYILFYAREGTPWFSTTFEEIKPLIEASRMRHSPNSVLESADRDCGSGYCNEDFANPNNAYNSVEVASPSAFHYQEPQEEVFHSAESNSDDSSMGDALEFTVADKPLSPETSPLEQLDMYRKAANPPKIRNSDDSSMGDALEFTVADKPLSPETSPQEQADMYRKAANPPKIRNQNCYRKRKEGSFKIQRDHLQSKKNLELIPAYPSKSINSVDPKDAKIALSYLKKQSSSRAKSLAAAVASPASSPAKKRKQQSNFKLPTANPHRHAYQL